MKWVLFLILCSSWLACATTSESESRLYKQVFTAKEGMFRGLNIGDKRDRINELTKPVYDDILGTVYDIPFSSAEKMRIHYYIDNLQTNKESNKIASIQAEIQIADEIETTRLYNEIQQNLTQKYGLPIGNYGGLKWESAAYSMEILLNIGNNRKQISLSYIGIK